MNKVEIGEFIRLNRRLQKLSQQQLAEKAGLTRRQQIIEMESASTDYGIDVLIKVVVALGYGLLVTQYLPEKKIDEIPSTESFDFSKVEPATEPPKTLTFYGHHKTIKQFKKLQERKTKTTLVKSKIKKDGKKEGLNRRKTKSSAKVR